MLDSDMESEKIGSGGEERTTAPHDEVQLNSSKDQPTALGAEKAYSPDDSNAVSLRKEDDEASYPPIRTVAIVMVALYIAMFLVSLVSLCYPASKTTTNQPIRTGLSSPQPSLKSPTSSTPSTMLDGTAVPMS
jgi:hypothetical protein